MTDTQRMQGTWDLQALEQDGKPAGDAPLVKLVIITDGRIAFRYVFPRSRGYSDEESRFTVDESKKACELSAPEGGPAYRGIYELDGDNLKICWSRVAGGNAPTDFTTSANSNRRLLVLTRSGGESS